MPSGAPSPLRREVGHVGRAGLDLGPLPLLVGGGRELCEGLLADDLVALLAADDLQPQARVVVPRHHVDPHEPRPNLGAHTEEQGGKDPLDLWLTDI